MHDIDAERHISQAPSSSYSLSWSWLCRSKSSFAEF